MAKAQVSKGVAEKPKSEIAEARPAYMQGTGLGNENVGQRDIVVPRLGIIQGLSPEIDPDSERFIANAQQGMMFNSLTRELFDEVIVVNCAYNREFPVFKLRKHGGGFNGTFGTEVEAARHIASLEAPAQYEAVETANHFCLLLDQDGPDAKTIGEIVIAMSSTKLKVSRNWNSMIRLRGADRFSCMWKILTSKEKNDKGTFYNFAYKPLTWVPEQIYTDGMNMYQSVTKGERTVERPMDEVEPGDGDI